MRCVATAAAALAVIAAAAAPALAKELRILAWQGYADPDWVKDFEDETGVDVNVVFIGTDDEIWAKIKGSEGKDFDLFAVNTAQLQRYHRRRPGRRPTTSPRCRTRRRRCRASRT